MAKNEGLVPETLNVTRPEVLTCRAMWEIIGQERLHVVIPYSTRVEFQSKANRRNPEMFYSLIKAHAMLFFMQRERHTLESGGSYIDATLEDFYAAAILFGHLNGTGGGQESKLTKREAEILNVISKRGDAEFTIQQLQFATNLSYNAIYRALHGYQSRGQTYSGLLDKCPAIGYTDRTIVCDDDDGRSVRRRSHAYLFTLATYRIWCTGGAVWLRPDSNNHDDKNNDETCNIAETFSTIAENSASLANGDTEDEKQNAASIINTDLSSSSSCSKSQITGPPVPCITTGTVCHRETGFAANDETVFDNLLKINPIHAPTSDTPDIKNAAKNILLQTAANQGGFPHVSFLDFKPIGCHENRTTCVSCGQKGVDYIEKVTPARESRKDKLAVRICKKCFDSAKRREQTKTRPLPGIIVLSRMVKISKDIGRCSICDTDKAVYHDREAGTRICQQCYDREAQTPGSVKGGAGQ